MPLNTNDLFPVPMHEQVGRVTLPGLAVIADQDGSIQEHDNWCWAACVLAVVKFQGITSPSTQCGVAKKVPKFKKKKCCPSVKGTPNPCDKPLDTHQVKRLFKRCGLQQCQLVEDDLTAQDLRDQLNKGSPVGIRVGTAAAGHFLVVYGWQPSDDEFELFDPAEGHGQISHTFEELLDYEGRSWTDTFTNLTP
jgi:Papain-like cysteine protease AvrRpt2